MRHVELSVVVPSVNGWKDLDDCLRALAGPRADVEMEVLVVDRIGEALRDRIRHEAPWARVIPVPPDTTIPAMRAIAFRAARGDSVAVIEDHVIVPAGWARALLDAQRDGSPVVGGAVENAATDRLVDWAAFLCEYSHCMPPLGGGQTTWLTGNNVVYNRELLTRYSEIAAAGGWENLIHDAMRRDGTPLLCRPDIVVGHKKHYTVGEYLSQRYLYARSYAGVRFQGASLPRRLGYGVASFALPPLLFARTISRVMSKKRNRAELVRSLPLLVLFVSAWAMGEMVGYVAGPGDSLSKVC